MPKRGVGRFNTIAPLVAPNGLLAMSLRHGPVPEGRTMFDITSTEIRAICEPLGFSALFDADMPSARPARHQLDPDGAAQGLRVSPPAPGSTQASTQLSPHSSANRASGTRTEALRAPAAGISSS